MTDRETHTVRQRRHTVDRTVASPARFLSGLIGLFFLVLGGVALARTGLGSLTGETATVLGFEHTALMAVIDIGAGLLFLGAAAASGFRGGLIWVSIISIAFGAVMAIEPGAMGSALGGGADLGLVYVVAGLLGLLAAVVFPTRVVDSEATHEDGAVSTY